MIPILACVRALCIGMAQNISLWFIGGLLSLVMGTLLGCLRHRHAPIKSVSAVIHLYVIIARGIPLYIHLLCMYFVVPQILGVSFSPYTAAVCAIVICVTAYCTEVIRAGIDAISDGQWEAARVLGYSYMQTLRYIILPQVIPAVLPVLGNLSEELLKSTAIVSVIGVLDITRTGMNIIARDMNPELVYALIAGTYLCVSLLMQGALHILHRRILYDRV
jgi:polar amino acid transport system permease protein